MSDQKVSLGIIGLGNIGQQHIATIQNELSDRYVISAVCDRVDKGIASSIGAKYFNNHKDLIASNSCAAIIVATPSFQHFEIGKDALEAGLHVLMEKPIGMSVREGEELLKASHADQKFAVMLNQRYAPAYAKAKDIIASGTIGKLTRYHWIMTNWFRPDIYFMSSDWRGTWAGEGGGLLVNQCIHNLDILQWLVGLPDNITASCSFGKYHNIEVEDEANAIFNHDNGMTGCFVGSTGEAPGTNQLEIVGTKGSLSFNGATLTLSKNTPDTDDFCTNTKDMFGVPETKTEEVKLDNEINQHGKVLANFADAILDGKALDTPAPEGLNSLQLANGILMSQWQEKRISLPLSAEAYQEELNKKLEASNLREDVDANVNIDMGKSFR